MAPEDLLALKVIWSLLLREGLPYTDRPGYYGGRPLPQFLCRPNGIYPGDYRQRVDKWRAALIERVKTVGVDWTKTTAPDWHTYGQFAGTFADHQGECHSLEGTLVLLDGEENDLAINDADKGTLPSLQGIRSVAQLIARGTVFD